MEDKYKCFFPEQWEIRMEQKLTRKMFFALEHVNKNGGIPYRAVRDAWLVHDGAGFWTDGLWGAMMWQMYLMTNHSCFREEALRTEKLLTEGMPNFTHDLGFLFIPLSGVHYELEGNNEKWNHESYKVLYHAAVLLAGRFNPIGQYIRVWKKEWMIVDTTMNLTLLYWAARQTGDPLFSQIAEKHLETMLKYIMRPDGSCNHIVEFDPYTGEVQSFPRGQGFAAGSSWSRGQAWALYGLTLAYRQTGNEIYRDAAIRAANYFVSCVSNDWIPDCDFRAPHDQIYKDSIAGACAACALLELADLLPAEQQNQYRYAGCKMILTMEQKCSDWLEDTMGILTMCSTAWHEPENRHTRWVMGDYFFVEAIRKVMGNPIQFWTPDLSEPIQ